MERDDILTYDLKDMSKFWNDSGVPGSIGAVSDLTGLDEDGVTNMDWYSILSAYSNTAK